MSNSLGYQFGWLPDALVCYAGLQYNHPEGIPCEISLQVFDPDNQPRKF
jgi:hypothetical protein